MVAGWQQDARKSEFIAYSVADDSELKHLRSSTLVWVLSQLRRFIDAERVFFAGGRPE